MDLDFRKSASKGWRVSCRSAAGPTANVVTISLKARNVPKLLVVWMLNVVVYSGVVMDGLDVRDVEALGALLSKVSTDPGAGCPYIVLLTVVSIFNGAIPRLVKEHLVFWPAVRPGSRAFSYFMLKDSTIDKKGLQQQFGPLPSDPNEQNALWVKWLHEFGDDTRVRPAYGLYLFARDWSVVAVTTFVLAGPMALWLAKDIERTLWYTAVLLVQCAFARWVARVQGEQLVISVMSCKGSSMGKCFGNKESSKGA